MRWLLKNSGCLHRRWASSLLFLYCWEGLNCRRCWRILDLSWFLVDCSITDQVSMQREEGATTCAVAETYDPWTWGSSGNSRWNIRLPTQGGNAHHSTQQLSRGRRLRLKGLYSMLTNTAEAPKLYKSASCLTHEGRLPDDSISANPNMDFLDMDLC